MEDESFLTTKVIFSLVLAGTLLLLGQLYHVLVLNLKRIRSNILKQGIKGPSPVFLYGNIPEIKRIQIQTRSKAAKTTLNISHAWPAILYPHLQQWRDEYGMLFSNRSR